MTKKALVDNICQRGDDRRGRLRRTLGRPEFTEEILAAHVEELDRHALVVSLARAIEAEREERARVEEEEYRESTISLVLRKNGLQGASARLGQYICPVCNAPTVSLLESGELACLSKHLFSEAAFLSLWKERVEKGPTPTE